MKSIIPKLTPNTPVQALVNDVIAVGVAVVALLRALGII